MAVITSNMHRIAPVPEIQPLRPGVMAYAVTVDTEEEWDWASGFPTRESSVENVAHLPRLQAVCERYGAKVTYYCNYAVMADPQSREVIQELASRPGVEIGLHIHPWNTPPLAPESGVEARESYLHNLPWDLAKAKLDVLFEVFDRAGFAPTSYRGGRYSTSARIQDYLRDHGILADASVLPYCTWNDDGAPDFRHRDLKPLRHPPRNLGDRALWELPLTCAYTRRPFAFWHTIMRSCSETWLRHLHVIGLLDRIGLVRKAWLNWENTVGVDLRGFLATLRAEHPPFLCFTLHSSSLMPGGSPYSRTEADTERLLAIAATTLEATAHDPDFQPATVTETALHLEMAHHASARD